MSAFSGTYVQNTQLYILNQIVRVKSSLIFPIAVAFKKRSLLVRFARAEMAGDSTENQLGEIISWVLVLPHIP